MNKRNEKLFALGAAVIVILMAFFYLPQSNSYFLMFFEYFEEPDWNNIPKKYVVKNSIPIQFQEKHKNDCLVSAEKFDLIVEHKYFIKGDEIASKLHYDKEQKTLTLPCDMLKGDKSILHVWYITEESPKHATKYTYFVTES